MDRLKVLYAAGNNFSSKTLLQRFLKHSDGFDLKIAAYKKSSPNVNIDFTLDSLLSLFPNRGFQFCSENMEVYKNYIKNQNFDIIISDLELFTSVIAAELETTLWQCSTSLLNFGMTLKGKYNSGIRSKYAHITKDHSDIKEIYFKLLNVSNEKFVYSHFGDIKEPPPLINGYRWVRPYHVTSEICERYKNNVTAGLTKNDSILNLLNKCENTVVFSNFPYEKHSNILMKDICDEGDYAKYISNCNFFACHGNTSFLADAYYNGKYTMISPIFDRELLISSLLTQKHNLGQLIFDEEEFENFKPKTIDTNFNNVKYLHELLEEI